jgi:hypothetical protein
MIKKLLLTTITTCMFFLTSVKAQKNSSISQKQLDLQTKQAAIKARGGSAIIPVNDNTPFGLIDAGSKEYNILKAEGKLQHYEIRMSKVGKPVVINSANKT